VPVLQHSGMFLHRVCATWLASYGYLMEGFGLHPLITALSSLPHLLAMLGQSIALALCLSCGVLDNIAIIIGMRNPFTLAAAPFHAVVLVPSV